MCTNRIYSFLTQISSTSLREIKKQYWNKQKFSYKNHPRIDWGIMLLIRGNVKFVTEEKTLDAKAGDMIFLPKGSTYEAIFENEIDDYLVNFSANGPQPVLSSPTLLFENTPIEIFKEFERFVVENNFENCSPLKSIFLFYSLLNAIVQNAISSARNGYNVIEKAKKLLLDKPDCTLEEIASICNISTSGLRKKFKESEGITLAEYRTRQKITRAKYLLSSTKLSISEISEMLGFYDASYLCRIFKKYEGVTPKKYVENKQL